MARGWKPLQADGRVAFASFEDVNEELIARLCPTVILSPVLARNFDCIDLAQVLCRLDFRGRYRAMAEALPDPALIQQEIATMCPNLDFGVLTRRDTPRYLTN